VADHKNPQQAERAPLWDRLAYGPLLDLPWARRLPIIRAVKAGGTVQNPGDAPYAARYAHRQVRRFRIAALACAALIALTIADLVVDGLQFQEIYGLAAIICGATSTYAGSRARRAETRALAFAHRQDSGKGEVIGTQ
jgi:hypothetical protein